MQFGAKTIANVKSENFHAIIIETFAENIIDEIAGEIMFKRCKIAEFIADDKIQLQGDHKWCDLRKLICKIIARQN